MTQPTLLEAMLEEMSVQEKVLAILQLHGAELLTQDEARELLNRPLPPEEV